ncbi:MAG: FAD-dependent oxidoreductase [Pseudomonadota bacterium]
MKGSTQKPILVIGAGIAGISSAIEAAEAQHDVVLVEQEPTVGGRALRNYHYFPKLCPPSCGMEINIRRLERSPYVQIMTSTRITKARWDGKSWHVELTRAPKYVNEKCTLCGACQKICPAKVPDPFNLGMAQVPAIRLAFLDAWPRRFVLDRHACPAGCEECLKVCEYDAIDLDANVKTQSLEVSAVILANGWKPYALDKLPELGGGILSDVIANVNIERMASPTGPTGGKILRPSDGKTPKRVVFIQCAGSRDVNHLPYCSAVCCMASLKQAIYVREQIPDSEVTIFYIDRRTPGRNEDLLTKVAGMERVELIKGKVGKVEKGPNDDLILRVENVESGHIINKSADLVVLATGMVPSLRDEPSAFDVQLDKDGFGLDNPKAKLFVAGVVRRPEDVAASVRDATGAAAKALMTPISQRSV